MTAKWIWTEKEYTENCYGEFLCEFNCNGEKTELEVSADTDYAVFVNGEFFYGGQFADFPWYKVSDTLDITKAVKNGKNAVKIAVRYGGDLNFTNYIGRPAVRFAVKVGGKTVAVSDKNTPSRELPYFVPAEKQYITWQIGYSFHIDLSRAERKYTPSAEVGEIAEKLVARPAKLLKFLPPVFGKPLENGVYDLGAETVGFPFISGVIPKGETVTVSFGEWLKEDGSVARIIGPRDFSFTVTGSGKPFSFTNRLRKLGLRYFQVEGNFKADGIGLIPVEYPWEENGYVPKGELRKKIYSTAVKTLKLNSLEHYFDCPWREQGFYALDSRFQMKYGDCAFKNKEYRYGALKLMSEDRNGDGMISIVVPTSHKLVIPSFALFYVVAMEEYATATGDKRLIEEYFSKMLALTEKFKDNMKNGLVREFTGENFWNFYEWNEGLNGVNKTEYESAINFTYLLELNSFIKICKMLGKESESAAFTALSQEIRSAINARFYDEKDGTYKFCDGSDTDYELLNAYAILTETATGERAKALAEKLVLSNGTFIPCTLSMLAFKYDALLKVSREKYADYVLKDIDGKYGYMLSQGATSFWETLKGKDDFDGAGSLCHGWSAMPAFYYKELNA